MKALILTCHTGEGHNSAAAALKDAFDRHNTPCDTADTLGFLSRFVSSCVRRAHEDIYRHIPTAFNVGYRAAEQHPATFRRKSFLYRLLTRGTKKLYALVTEQGYDTIVCTHPFATLLATDLREKHPELSIYCAFVATDYTCCPSVNDGDMDVYCIPDASLADEFIAKGVPGERLLATGIPVRGAFMTAQSKDDALAAAGLDPSKRHLLLMGGSMGCGPIKELTARLSDALPADVTVTVICGTNHALYRKLARRFADRNGVRVVGFVRNISALMSASDLYLTKPGGISTTEAAAKGLPMVLLHAVAGCEDYNRRFYIERGMARSAPSTEELCALCVSLLSSPDELRAMRESIARHAHPDAADRIFDFIHSQSTAKEPS